MIKILLYLFLSIKNITKDLLVPYLNVDFDTFKFFGNFIHGSSIHINIPLAGNRFFKIRVGNPHLFKQKRETLIILKILSNKSNGIVIQANSINNRKGASMRKNPIISDKGSIKSYLNEVFTIPSIRPGVGCPIEIHVNETIEINKVHQVKVDIYLCLSSPIFINALQRSIEISHHNRVVRRERFSFLLNFIPEFTSCRFGVRGIYISYNTFLSFIDAFNFQG